ncbi:MAG: hypothetical protein NT027_16935 [Proteobacteria bacterium]|nr:hypothetical protein [Pseudomonadota bacterium]
MHKDSFDLEFSLSQFLNKIADKKLVSRQRLEEIESHLRDEIDDLQSHHELPEAFNIACTRFGSSEDILSQYETIFKNRRLAQLKNFLSYYFDGRFVMRILTGVILGLGFIFGGMAIEGGNAHSVMRLTPFLITVGGALAGLIIAYPTQHVFRSFAIAMTGKPASRAEYIDASRVFKSFGDFAVLSGLVGVIVGIMHVTRNLVNPEQIGPGVYVGLVCIFYTVMLKLFVCNPMHDSFVSKAYPSRESREVAPVHAKS